VHSAAGEYLHKMGLPEEDFNSYATHRGDHLTAQRATFANPKLLNEMCRDESGEVIQGSLARLEPEGRCSACGKPSKPIWSASSP
jgi:aconitate hydratase